VTIAPPRAGGPPAAPAGAAGAGAAAPGSRAAAPPPAAAGAAPGSEAATAAAAGARGGRGGGAGGGGGGGRGAALGSGNAVTAVASDGFVHIFNVQNGAEMTPPIEFLPPNSAPAGGLILADDVLYAAIASGCGGVDSGVWALDLANQDKKPVHWTASGGSIAGTAGPTLGSDGTIYVALGGAASSVVALEPKTLRIKDSFVSDAADFKSSVVAFPYNGRALVAAAGGDGKMYLFDAASLGGSDHKTPLSVISFAAPGFATGALATWQDASGTRFVLAPSGKLAASVKFPVANGAVTNGTIAAFKVTEQNGKPALEPAWTSRDLTSPLPPIVVSGVVFALSSGEARSATSAAITAQRSTPAVLYALDGATGKTLWSSGQTVTSFAHSGGLVATPSQIYFVTYDGTLWAFGMPTERE
jgi:WD40 repeat protein